MIIFLYGADSYRSKEKLDEIIAQYKTVRKSGLNLMFLDAKEKDFSDFYDTFKISPMFAETKLVILKNIFSSKPFQEKFQEHLKQLVEFKDVILVYEDEAPDERLKLFKTLLKEVKCQEFALLDSKGVKLWAQKYLEGLGTLPHRQASKINNDALELMVSFIGNDLWRFSNELQKLASYKQGGIIQKADVQMMVKPNIENDIFKTIDALAERNKKQALALLHKHLDGEDNPLYLLSMIAYQFRNLLMVKELSEKGLMYASIIKKSGLHPFVVKKTYFQCRQFTFEQLKDIYRRVYEIDSDIKVGKVDAETALDLLVSKI